MYKYMQICNEQYMYRRKSYINQWNKRKEIINNNMKMKNTKCKMDKKNIAYIMKGNRTQHENIIEHTILF